MRLRFHFWKKKKKYVHGTSAEDRKRILSDTTPFAVKEAYRATYTNLFYLPITDPCKRIAITSAVPGEGKTTLAINLAITLAQNSSDCRILLVDADLSKSRIARLLGQSGRVHGLSEYLAGIDAEPNILSTNTEGLSVLYSGKATTNSAALIASDRMEALMQYCAGRYEYVLFDTPPVSTVSNAMLMKKSVNGYLLAVRSGFSDIHSMNEAIETMQMLEAPIFGLILNSVDSKNGKGAKYYKNGKYAAYNSYSYSDNEHVQD